MKKSPKKGLQLFFYCAILDIGGGGESHYGTLTSQKLYTRRRRSRLILRVYTEKQTHRGTKKYQA